MKEVWNKVSLILFIIKNRIKTEDGTPYLFKDYRFMIDPLRDMINLKTDIVIYKAAQIGFSTAAILASLWIAKNKAIDIIYCVDEETEILTKRGFLHVNDLLLSDKALSIDMKGKAHWSVISEIFRNNVTTNIYTYKQRNFNAVVTENHRWIIKNVANVYSIVESKDLKKQCTTIPKTAEGLKVRKVYTDEYVELLSWIFSEGYYCKQEGKNCYSIIITQSDKNKRHQDRIKELIKLNGAEFKIYRNSHNDCSNYRFAFELGRKIKQDFPKKIPTAKFASKLTQKQAKIFIDTFVYADGWIDKHGTKAITQKKIDNNINLLHMIGVIAGYAPSSFLNKNGTHTIRMTQYNKIWCGELKPQIEYKNIDVWCPRTKYGTFYARRHGRSYWTGNTLPTSNDVKDFAGGKINRIIAQNPILLEWVKERDTVEQKTVGNNIVYYRGTWSNKAASMVSSDLNIYDEVDASNQKVIEQYSTRLQASEIKREWFFSHPSVPNNGVAKKWHKSDQKHWFIICSHCNQEQYMSFPESFDMEKEIYVCEDCNGEIYDDDRRRGRWVAKEGEYEMSGYWIPLFISPKVTAKDILGYHRDKSEEYFYNKVLGLPYVGSGNVVTHDILTRNLTDEINQQEGKIVIGVDTGIHQYYVCGNKDGLFYYGKSLNGYEDIEKLMDKWDNAVIVMDVGGDLVASRALREKYIGRVFLCHYSVDRKTLQLVRWGKDKEEGNVNVDRNRMIQLVIDEFADKRIPLQGNENDWWDFWLHWKNIFRIEKENSLGVMERKWERSGDDHYVHAVCYWRTGMDRFGYGEGGIIGSGKVLRGIKITPAINPDQTMRAPDTNAIIKRATKRR